MAIIFLFLPRHLLHDGDYWTGGGLRGRRPTVAGLHGFLDNRRIDVSVLNSCTENIFNWENSFACPEYNI